MEKHEVKQIKPSMPMWLKASLAIVGVLLVVALIILASRMSNGGLSKQEAEKLALEEIKNFVYDANINDYTSKEEFLVEFASKLKVLYSEKKEDGWHVWVTGWGKSPPVEVIVQSKDSIRIPLLEENLKSDTASDSFHTTLLSYATLQSDGSVLPDENRCAVDCAKKCVELNMVYKRDYNSAVVGQNGQVINYHCECYCKP